MKLGECLECDIFNKYSLHKKIKNYIGGNSNSNNRIFYRTAGGGYWTTFLNADFDSFSVSNKSASINENIPATIISSSLNSSLFWWYYSINYDLFNFKDYMIFGFQFNIPNLDIKQKLHELSNNMEFCLRKNALFYEINSQTAGKNRTVTYQKAKSKEIMDLIDTVLATHYSFTEKELDFIINYDIKFRMGDDED